MTLARIVSALSIVAICSTAASLPVYADELQDIQNLLKQGNQGQALDRANAYLVTHPKDAQVRFLKGVALTEQNKTAEAIKVFTALTEDFPELPEPYNNLAVLYASQQQYDKARQALEMAIQTHPSYATAHENLGDIYAKMASVAYDRALKLDKSNAAAQTKLSLIKDIFPINSRQQRVIAKPSTPAVKPTVVAAAHAPAVVVPTPAPTPIPTPIPTPAKAPEKPVEKVEKPKQDPSQAITDAVNSWAQAWSSKNLDQYFTSYGANFQPAKGESRKAWEQQRKERINKPSKIDVSLSNINIINIDSNNAKVSFKQSYRADGKPIYTTKTLFMKKDGDNWFIEQEVASN